MDPTSPPDDMAEVRTALPLTRCRRWLRLPGFWVAAASSFVALAAFVLWVRVDAQLPTTLYTIRVSLGLETIDAEPAFVELGFLNLMWKSVTSWNRLGSRRALFVALSFVAIMSSAIALFRCYFTGDKRRWSILRLAVASLIAAAWITLWVCYGQIEWWAIRQRARSALPRFEAAAAALRERWPSESQTVPELGDVLVAPDKYPGLLFLINRRPFPMQEGFGMTIERSEAGTIRFSLAGSLDCQLEHHLPGSAPRSYTDVFGNRSEMRDAVSCSESWYLVRYK